MASAGSSIAAARALVVRDARLLYRRVLRAHRLLPLPMRQLGDAHVRHEWREALRRGDASSAEDTARFLGAWREYAGALESGELGSMRDELEHLNDEQRQRMEEMRQAATGSDDDPPPSSSPPSSSSSSATSSPFR